MHRRGRRRLLIGRMRIRGRLHASLRLEPPKRWPSPRASGRPPPDAGAPHVLFTFAANSDPIAFTAFGRDIPVYLALIYPAFIGWGSYVAYRLANDGASAAKVFWVCALFFPLDALIEVIGQEANLWAYYGRQSWNPMGWPMYFGVLNASITLIGGALLLFVDKHLRSGERVFCQVLCVPTAYVGIYAVAGWPTWAALNSGTSTAMVWICGALTMLIAVVVARVLAERMVPSRQASPAEWIHPRV